MAVLSVLPTESHLPVGETADSIPTPGPLRSSPAPAGHRPGDCRIVSCDHNATEFKNRSRAGDLLFHGLPRTIPHIMERRPDQKSERLSSMFGRHIPVLICVGLLIIAAFSRWPYGIYILLRIVVRVTSFYAALAALEKKSVPWSVLLFSNAVLFNPVFPIRMRRHDWEIANLISAAMLCIWIIYAVSQAYRRRSANG